MTAAGFVIPTHDEPRLVKCAGCNKEYLEVWFDGPARRRAAGRHVPPGMPDGWWAPPPLNPCPGCVVDRELELERAVRQRLYGARVPAAYHGYRLDGSEVCVQRQGEPVDDFMARARKAQKFGAFEKNLLALRSLRDWLTSSGGRLPQRWVVIHGPPGTGKTAVLGAIARALLSVRPLAFVPLPDKLVTMKPVDQDAWDYAESRGLLSTWTSRKMPHVEYEDASDLLERHTAKFKGEHNNEARDAARVDVLLLDELGANPKIREAEHEMIKGLLVQRHNHGRLTVVATNRAWAELTTRGAALYGDAVADRLGSALRVELGGPSWR